MVLNDFLSCRLGVLIEDKYNALAVEEILSNKENYPVIAQYIVDEMDNAEVDEKDWDYDSWFFDCDDETCAGYRETMELYRAFVSAIAKDLRDKDIRVKYASFGIEYLAAPNVAHILDAFFLYRGRTYVCITAGRTELNKVTFYPVDQNDASMGHEFTEHSDRLYHSQNSLQLQKIAESFKNLCESNYFFENRFDNEDLQKYPRKLDSGVDGYPYDFYEFSVGDNYLKFYTTERGFDAFSCVRMDIMDTLTPEQKDHPTVKEIESVYF